MYIYILYIYNFEKCIENKKSVFAMVCKEQKSNMMERKSLYVFDD